MPADAWADSRARGAELQGEDDLDRAAAAYVAAWPNHPPDAFRYEHRQRRAAVSRAFDNGAGWASRLLMSCPNPTHYTLDAKALGLSPADTNFGKLRDPETIARWKAAISRTFGGPHRAKLEAGAHLHAHVLADRADCPATVRYGSKRAKPCVSYYTQVVGYLCKPAAPYTAEHLATYWRAKRTMRRLPRLSWTGNLPRNLPTAPTNVLRVSNLLAPSQAIAKAPTPPTPAPAPKPATKHLTARPSYLSSLLSHTYHHIRLVPQRCPRPEWQSGGSSEPIRQPLARGPPRRCG